MNLSDAGWWTLCGWWVFLFDELAWVSEGGCGEMCGGGKMECAWVWFDGMCYHVREKCGSGNFDSINWIQCEMN